MFIDRLMYMTGGGGGGYMGAVVHPDDVLMAA